MKWLYNLCFVSKLNMLHNPSLVNSNLPFELIMRMRDRPLTRAPHPACLLLSQGHSGLAYALLFSLIISE